MDFNQAALEWDNSLIRVERAQVVSNRLLNSIPIGKDFKALEFGCGTGLLSFNLYKNFKELTLIDSSKGMIDVLKEKIKKNKINNMIPVELNLVDSKQIEKRFDVVYTLMTLHHIKDYSKTLEILYELLENNGWLCIIDLVEEDGSFHKDEKDFFGHNGFNIRHTINLLKKIGLKNAKSEIIYNNKKIIDGKEKFYPLFLITGNK